MGIGAALLKKISKKFEPASGIEMKFGKYDCYLKTDEEGNAIMLFIGKKMKNGMIRGERYARRLVKDEAGNYIKDHWELKGKATE